MKAVSSVVEFIGWVVVVSLLIGLATDTLSVTYDGHVLISKGDEK